MMVLKWKSSTDKISALFLHLFLSYGLMIFPRSEDITSILKLESKYMVEEDTSCSLLLLITTYVSSVHLSQELIFCMSFSISLREFGCNKIRPVLWHTATAGRDWDTKGAAFPLTGKGDMLVLLYPHTFLFNARFFLKKHMSTTLHIKLMTTRLFGNGLENY